MARYLAYTTPARGHLYPIVPMLAELRRRGHTVAVRTLADEVDRMRGLGFAASPIAAAIEARSLDDWKARSQTEALAQAARTFIDRAQHEVPDLRAAIVAESPDALLIDVNAWGATAAAEVSGLPWALYSPYCVPLPSRDAPPFGLGLAPRSDMLGKVRDAIVGSVVHRAINRQLPSLNAMRARVGARPIAHMAEYAAVAPLVLALTAEPFEYPHRDWPKSVRLVGPGIWDPPAVPPPWLDESSEPLILVTASTELQDDGRLIETALAALRDEPVRLVVTTAAIDPARFAAQPRARIERFLPHGPLLARAACLVCHGGMGVTQKALSAGVPVCAVPFGRDQPEVARRVEVSGAGTRLPASRLSPERLRAAVKGAMACKAGAERIAAAFSATGPRTAADALEDLLPPAEHCQEAVACGAATASALLFG
jgi:MGT family glycosyltransferase